MDPEVFEYRMQRARQLVHDHPRSCTWASFFPLWNISEPGYVGKVINGLDENFAYGALAFKLWKNIDLEAGLIFRGHRHECHQRLRSPIALTLHRFSRLLFQGPLPGFRQRGDPRFHAQGRRRPIAMAFSLRPL